MSQPQPSPSSPHTASSAFAQRPARVPRRFAAGTLMILTAVYGLIIRGLMALDAPMGAVVTIAGVLTAAGAAQVFLFRGERPRHASIALGAVAAPLCAGIYAFIDSSFGDTFFFFRTALQNVVTVYYFIILGATLGYVSGCIAAGLFLLLGRIPWLRMGLDEDQANAAIEATHSQVASSTWRRTISLLSVYQIDRPVREFGATAGILLAVSLPLAIYMPWWQASVYLQIVSAIAIGVAFLRTGLRQFGWRLAAAFSLFSLLCSIAPAIMTANVNWADGFAIEVAVIGAAVASFLTGTALTAGIGWCRWIGRSLSKRRDGVAERVVLGILIVSVNVGACGYIVFYQRQPEQVALTRVHELNGSVAYSYPTGNLLDGQVDQVYLHRSPVTDEDLQLITALNTATHLSLSKSSITDVGMPYLQRFPQLVSLSLRSSHVTDDGVEHLHHFKSLGMLSLRDTKITANGVRSLKSLNVRILTLSGPNLDASALNELADMPMLVSLCLDSVDLHGADLSTLARIPYLKTLALVNCSLHDEDLDGLVALPKLEELLLGNNPITDRGIKHLKQIKLLGKVDLFETQVTEAGVDELQAQSPSCVVQGN